MKNLAVGTKLIIGFIAASIFIALAPVEDSNIHVVTAARAAGPLPVTPSAPHGRRGRPAAELLDAEFTRP